MLLLHCSVCLAWFKLPNSGQQAKQSGAKTSAAVFRGVNGGEKAVATNDLLAGSGKKLESGAKSPLEGR